MHPALQAGLCVALVYAALAGWLIACDRRPHNGSWINLSGLVSLFATFPMWRLAARCGCRLDPRRNDHMLFAVLGTAGLVALASALLVWPFVD